MSGPLLEEWRQKLKEVGVDLLEFLPPDSYTARLKPEQVKAVQQLPFIGTGAVSMMPRTPCSRGRLLRGLAPAAVQRMQAYEARLHRPEDLSKVRNWLDEKGVAIAGAQRPQDSTLSVGKRPPGGRLCGVP